MRNNSMKNFSVSLILLVLLSGCSGIKKYNAQVSSKIPVKSLHKDLDYTYRKLRKLHPKLDQYIAKDNLALKFDSVRNSITEPLTGREFYYKIAPVIFSIRQGHISLGPPRKKLTKKERKAYAKTKFELGQLKFEVLQKKLWVKAVYGNDSTLVGSQVLKIDNKPFTELLQNFKQQFSSDGFNTTLYDRFVGEQFAQMYLRDLGVLDSVNLTFAHKDSVFSRTLRRIPIDSLFYAEAKDTTIQADSSSRPKKKLTKAQKKEQKKKWRKEWKYNNTHGHIRDDLYTRNFKFIDSTARIAYMKIRHFGNGAYKKFYKESFAKMDSVKSTTLILDLRDNPGGRLAEIDKLYSYLSLAEYQLILPGEIKTRTPFLTSIMSKNRPFLMKAFAGLFSPIIIPIELFHVKRKDGKRVYTFSSSRTKSPNSQNFKGKIYVLINGNSFSASSIISTNLQATKRAIFVGEETGGAYNGTVAGLMKYIELPHSKVRMNFGMIQIEAPYKTPVDGFGVKPDVPVIPTPIDREKGVDPELEWVLNEVKTNRNSIN